MATRTGKAPEDIASRAGELLMRLGLALLMIALPLAAIYSRRLVFTLMPVGAGLILAGATLMPGNTVMADLRRALTSPAAFAAIGLLVWIAASLLWTPFLRQAAEQFAKSAATIGLAVVVVAALPGRSRTSNLNLMPIGSGLAAVAAAALVFLLPASLPISVDPESTTLERAAAGLVLLVWPALSALGVRERWASAGVLAVAVTVAAIATWTPAALAGMAAGAVVFAVSTSNPRRTGLVLAVLFGLLIMIAPVLPLLAERLLAAHPGGVPLAATKAVSAWSSLILDDPGRLITGFGYTTFSRAVGNGFLPAGAPPSILVEVWFELGILGALGFAAAVAGAFAAAGQVEEHGAPFLLAALVCVLTIAIWGLATFHLWWINMLGAMAISFGCVLKGRLREGRPSAGFVKNGPQPAV